MSIVYTPALASLLSLQQPSHSCTFMSLHLGFEKVGPCPWRELLNKSLTHLCSFVPLLNTIDLYPPCSCDLNDQYQSPFAVQVPYTLSYGQSSMLLSEVPG